MHETDAEILDALRKNINKGGELLFKRYYKPLVMFADTFLPGSDVAEDFVQDVFYRFIKDKTFLHMTPDGSTYPFFEQFRDNINPSVTLRKKKP